MAKFKKYDYNQKIMVPVCLDEQLIPGTLEYAIHMLIENRIDMSLFDAKYNNDDSGCTAYDPKVILKSVLLGYSRGLLSSRKIENACNENIVFMALTCGQAPDHSTIASFVSSMEKEIIEIFRKVLLICSEEGLLDGTNFALDGCKLPSNASKQNSGTFKQLEQKKQRLEKRLYDLLQKHKTNDLQDHDSDKSRVEKLEKLQKSIEKIEHFLNNNKPKPGRKKKKIKATSPIMIHI